MYRTKKVVKYISKLKNTDENLSLEDVIQKVKEDFLIKDSHKLQKIPNSKLSQNSVIKHEQELFPKFKSQIQNEVNLFFKN
jgi:hypothetical protein